MEAQFPPLPSRGLCGGALSAKQTASSSEFASVIKGRNMGSSESPIDRRGQMRAARTTILKKFARVEKHLLFGRGGHVNLVSRWLYSLQGASFVRFWLVMV